MGINVRRFLREQGCVDEEIERAEAEGWLTVLVLDHLVLPGERRYTAGEVAARAGVDRTVSKRLWRAMGFPDAFEDERAFADVDVKALENALEAVPDEAALDLLVQQARVIGASMARVAEVLTDALIRGVRDLADAGRSQEEIAATLAETFQIDRLAPIIDYIHRRQLVASLRRRLVGQDGAMSGVLFEAVGFADLAGFTKISQQLGSGELTTLINRFESSSRDVVASLGGRVVKSIGDEIMFVADQPLVGARIALAIVEVHERDDVLPPVKVGLDHGKVLILDGDYFGPVVNRASRMTELAREASVLTSAELRETLADEEGFRWSDAGRRKLKDIGSVHLWRLRSAPGDGGGGGDVAGEREDVVAEVTAVLAEDG
ncbi:adenylate/guanylate cyclase domain-containing protein [soil metagenome]